MGRYIETVGKGTITPAELGSRIRAIRVWRGYGNRSELCKRIGLNRNTLGSYESAKSTPSYFALVLLASAFDISVDQLLALEVIPGFDASEKVIRDAGRERLVACYEKGLSNAKTLDAVAACLAEPDDKQKVIDAVEDIITATSCDSTRF